MRIFQFTKNTNGNENYFFNMANLTNSTATGTFSEHSNANRKIEGGLRKQRHFKRSLPGKPLITVITVVLNGEKHLERTILSVISQTYENIEYIIIDGNSTDGTVDIIKKYENQIDYWISEKDCGIYNAMNKGIDLASGEWINFMNSGDRFYLTETISQCSSYVINSNATFVYGDMVSDYGSFTKINQTKSLDQFWKGMVFSHQSAFIRSNYHKREKYNLDYPVAGDFEFFYRSYIHGESFINLDKIVSVMSVCGLSDTNRSESISQKYSIIKLYKPSFRSNVYYKYLFLDNLIRSLLKNLLPEKIVHLIQKIK